MPTAQAGEGFDLHAMRQPVAWVRCSINGALSVRAGHFLGQATAILKSIWRRLPIRFRRSAFRAAINVLAPALPMPVPASLEPGAPRIVAGFLTSPSGLGQSARLAIKAFSGAGHDTYGVDLSYAFNEPSTGIKDSFRDGRRLTGPGQVLINVNAPFMKYTLQLLGRRLLQDKHVTGYWAWELERAPDEWRNGLACVHRVAVPSRFVAGAVEALGWRGDIIVAPHPVALEGAPPLPPRPADQPFTIVSSFNVASGFVRKNPVALVEAFKLAFPNNAPARLRVLATNTEHYPEGKAALLAAVGGDPRIELCMQSLSREEYWRWYGAPDLFASLHRAEGFGLGIAESMCRGVAVLATDWSANSEFVDAESGFPVNYTLTPVSDPQLRYEAPGSLWAEPDIGHAAELMRRAAEDSDLRVRLATIGKQRALARFSSFPLA